jgi:hypothetical protein
MPTLGELIARARTYGYTRHIIRVPELRARITYLRRGEGSTLKAVVESLCQRLEIPAEDFGL